MIEETFDSVTIVNDDSKKDIEKQKINSWSVVTLDPVFNTYTEELTPWLINAERILEEGGNLISINYPIANRDIYAYIKSNLKSLTLKDTITCEQGSAYRSINGLPRRQLSIDVYYKGPITSRKFYAKIDGRIGHALYAPEHANVLTDMMLYKQHYPCRKAKDGKVVHEGAMAKWLVNNILHCYAREGDSVYDSFGGAGTFPAICKINKITCRSVEINIDNYNLMKKEILSTTKYRTLKIINAFIKSTEILNESSSRTTNIVERSIQRRANNHKKISINE